MGFPTEETNVEALILGVVAVCIIALDGSVDIDVAIIRGVQRFVGELCPSWFPIIKPD